MQATNSVSRQYARRPLHLWFLDAISAPSLGFYPLLLLSGFCGISYEILYARIFGNLLGDQMMVSASILTTFLLGIGIGTRYAYYLWRWLWAIELGIGLCGLFFAFGSPLLDYMFFRSGSILLGTPIGYLSASIALMMIPSTLIGCSLPLFAGYLSHLKEGRTFARTYTIYNIGAAITALLIEFALVRTFGLQGALIAIAALNILVAVMLVKHFGQIRYQRPARVARVEFPWNHKVAIALVSVGSAVFQLMMIKVAECLFGPYHETFALILATVLLGIALGSFLAERFNVSFNVVVCAALLGLVWFLWRFDAIAHWYAANYETAVDDYSKLVFLKISAVMWLIGLPAIAFGAVIPAMLHNQKDIARESGELLFISSVANALGFVLMAFVLHQHFSYGLIVVVVALLAWLGNFICSGFKPARLAAASVLVMATIFVANRCWNEDLLFVGHTSYHSAEELDQTRQEMKLTQVFKGHQDVFAITTIDEKDYFFINGYISIPLSSASERIVGAYSSIFAPRTDDALVLGVGSGATVGTVGRIFDRTTAVEINPVILDNLFRMSQYNFDADKNPKVNIVLDDGIHFVKTNQEKYSLIINTVTTPLYFSSSKLYTNDFLKHVRGRLTDDGVYVTWFDFRVGDRGLDIVLNTLRQNFQHCAIGCVKSRYFLLMCSNSPLRAQQPDVVSRNAVLSKHFRDEHDFNPDWFAYGVLYPNAFDLIGNEDEPINTLNYPALEFEMSRLGDAGIKRFLRRLKNEMSLEQQRLILEPHVKWDPRALLLHTRELLGNSDITRRWRKLVDKAYPEAYAQSRRLRAAELEKRAATSDTAEAYFDCGYAWMKVDEYELAIEKFNVVLKKDPMFNNAHFNLGACYEGINKYEKSLEHFELELELHDDDDTHFRIGRAAVECGQFAKAEAAIRRAIELNDDSENRVMLAKALLGQGHEAQAKAELQTALNMDSADEQARDELRRLLMTSVERQ